MFEVKQINSIESTLPYIYSEALDALLINCSLLFVSSPFMKIDTAYFGEWFIIFPEIRFDCISSGCSLGRL